jgi:hypothetical protein
MTPSDLLAELERALADAGGLKGNDVAMTLVMPGPELLGEHGRRHAPTEDGRATYTFTLAQVTRMDYTMREAIREDAGLPPQPQPAPERRRHRRRFW